MFFRHVVSFAEQAALNLGVTLTTHYALGSHHRMIQQVEAALKKEDRSAGFMFVNFKGIDKQIIELAEHYRTPVLVFNTQTTPRFLLGKPRENYRFWIGTLLPDDEGAGYQLMNTLAGNRKGLSVTAFAGEYATGSSIARIIGLKRALKDNKNWKLNQIVHAFWDPETASKKAISLLKRYPDTDIFWSASDGMALGAIAGCEQVNKPCNIRVGGVDWTEEGLQAIASGKLQSSMGGHFMEAAWGLIMLYDYHNGNDFRQQGLEFKDPMYVVTQENLDKARLVLDPASWKHLDFRSYSLTHNPTLKHYDFSVESVLKQLQKQTDSSGKLPLKPLLQ